MKTPVAAAVALALAAALPAAHALHVCTDAAGKSTIQDKPCAARDAAPQFVPAKAAALTPALALDAAHRLSGAMQARDVSALRRLLARGFEARLTGRNGETASLDATRFGEFTGSVLHALKSYQVTRTCRHDPAGDSAGVVALRCRYSDRMEYFQRTQVSQGDEYIRVTLEDGEVRVLELSDPKVVDAAKARLAAR